MTMCELAGESRNVTAEATSLASATRPVGMRGRITSKLPLAKSSIAACPWQAGASFRCRLGWARPC